MKQMNPCVEAPPPYQDIPPPPYRAPPSHSVPLPHPFDQVVISDSDVCDGSRALVKVGDKVHRVWITHNQGTRESWVGFKFLYRCAANKWGSVVFANGAIFDSAAYYDTHENRIRRALAASAQMRQGFLSTPNFHDAGYVGDGSRPQRMRHYETSNRECGLQ